MSNIFITDKPVHIFRITWSNGKESIEHWERPPWYIFWIYEGQQLFPVVIERL